MEDNENGAGRYCKTVNIHFLQKIFLHCHRIVLRINFSGS